MLHRHPVARPVILRDFMACPEEYKKWGFPGHEGVDYKADTGEPVYACSPGSVYRVVTDPDAHPYGIHVRVFHQLEVIDFVDLSPVTWETITVKTIYAHLSKALVTFGQSIGVGRPIGEVGSTGNSSCPHLHLTVKAEGIDKADYAPGFNPSLKIVNPWHFLPPIYPSLATTAIITDADTDTVGLHRDGGGSGDNVSPSLFIPEDQIEPIFQARIIYDSLNVRVRPSVRSKVVSFFQKDDVFNIYELNSSEAWGRTDIGWVALHHNSLPLVEIIPIPLDTLITEEKPSPS